MRLPFFGAGIDPGGKMASQVTRIGSAAHAEAIPFRGYPATAVVRGPEMGLNAACVTAYSVDFVAKPGEALKAQSSLAAAVTGTLQGVTGFAGCILMTSDQEARLMTLVTFWRGSERAKHCNANTKWVNALIAPYMDRRLRVQTMVAQLPAVTLSQSIGEGASDADARHSYVEQDQELSVA
jgi:hypothetical protein